MGANVVDLRGIAMERLEARLDRLEDTHRAVIAAAYENLAGTNQVHRAILQMLDPARASKDFLRGLGGDVAQTLRVDCVRLVLECGAERPTTRRLRRLGDVLCVAEPGFVADYIAGGAERPAAPGDPAPDRAALGARSMANARAGSGPRRCCGSISARVACRACWCWGPRTRTGSSRPRAPTCWPSSAACSSGRCAAGWRDRRRAGMILGGATGGAGGMADPSQRAGRCGGEHRRPPMRADVARYLDFLARHRGGTEGIGALLDAAADRPARLDGA